MSEKLFDAMLGSAVEILLKSSKVDSFHGYLLDFDEEYLFMGDTHHTVTKAFKRDDIVAVFQSRSPFYLLPIPDTLDG